jgi:hypothetical protein
MSFAVESSGCAAAESPELVKEYRAATCVGPVTDPKIHPHTRAWQSRLSLSGSSAVIVKGVQAPGGRITLEYPETGHQVVAADAGDYVYPADVRINGRSGMLYVKASGLAGGMSDQTWLFKYDLSGRKLVIKVKVDPKSLPAECTERK